MYSTLLITTYSLLIYKLDNIVNEKKKDDCTVCFFTVAYANDVIIMGVHIILYLKVSDVTPLSPRQAPKAIIFLDQATCLLIVQMKLCLPFGCLFDRAPEVWF